MLRWCFGALVAVIFAAPVAALDLSKMSQEEQDAFGEAVRSYLLENPQVIMDAVAALEQQQAEAQAEADLALVADHSKALFEDGFSYVGGNPEGDITVVEFLDYRCGFCRRAHPEVARLLETDKNIRLIVKEFPILGEQSVLASRFAIATRQLAGEDAYKMVSDALIEFSGEISEASLSRMAGLFGLDGAAIIEQMMGPDVTEEIEATRALAAALQINGTPTFVMQDELIRGFVPFDQMMHIISEKRG